MNRRNFLRAGLVAAAAVTGLARARVELLDGPGAEPIAGADFGQDDRAIVGHVRKTEWRDGQLTAVVETARVRPTDGRAIIRVPVTLEYRRTPPELGDLVRLNPDGTVGG